jgi:5'-deoxynucleotidase YfbR-like HD superfamily hydrolase
MRYHTWPHIHEQTVGEHSMQVMRIILALYPEAPRHLLIHCMTHDVGEMVSGDPPYPVKRNNADLKKICDRIERDAHLSMCLPWALPGPQVLTEEEHDVFKLAEFIEMAEWGIDEVRLGNTEGLEVIDRCLDAMRSLLECVSIPVRSAANLYLKRRMNGMEEYYGSSRRRSL